MRSLRLAILLAFLGGCLAETDAQEAKGTHKAEKKVKEKSAEAAEQDSEVKDVAPKILTAAFAAG